MLSLKPWIWKFNVVIWQTMSKNCTKVHAARAACNLSNHCFLALSAVVKLLFTYVGSCTLVRSVGMFFKGPLSDQWRNISLPQLSILRFTLLLQKKNIWTLYHWPVLDLCESKVIKINSIMIMLLDISPVCEMILTTDPRKDCLLLIIYWPQQNLSYVSYDPRSYECNLCNCVCRSLKNSGLQRGLNLWPCNTGATL